MKNYIFTCKNCNHAIQQNDSQSGCEIGNLKILIDSNQAALNPETGYYDLERVCLGKHDSKVKFNYLFILKDSNLINQLYTNINQAVERGAVWIGVIHDFPDKGDEIIEKLKTLECKHFVAANYEKFDDVFKLDQPMNSYINGWTIVNIVGEEFNHELTDQLSKYLTTNQKPVALVRNYDESINGMAFLNIIYKFLKGSRPIKDEYENILHVKVYEEKITEMSPDMVKSWKEIYEISDIITNQ